MTEQLSKQIAETLGEPNIVFIRQIITVIGTERTQVFLTQAQETLAQGGLLRKDGQPRTSGGVFFYLVREGISKAERRQLWPSPAKKTTRKATDQPTRPPPTLSWAEAIPFVAQAIQSIGEASIVKITLIGQPINIVQQPTCVLVSMKGKEPPSLPKGLPTPPEGSAITWAVFIVNKQWAKVSASVQQHADDQLIIEGYPVVDTKRGVGVVLASSCKSMRMERAAPRGHPDTKAKG